MRPQRSLVSWWRLQEEFEMANSRMKEMVSYFRKFNTLGLYWLVYWQLLVRSSFFGYWIGVAR
jgi:hypothetical protein